MSNNSIRLAAASALMLSSCQLASPVPARPGYNEYGITEISGSLELSAESREEKRRTANGDLDLSELRFREQLKLALAGFYYHPKLVEFTLDTMVGLEQRDFESSGDIQSNTLDGQNLGYEFLMRFFKDMPYTVELYTLRNETITRQNFFATNEAVVKETGLRARAKEWWIPSLMSASHYTYMGRGLNRYEETRDTVRAEGHREEDNAQYSYLAELNKVDLQGLPEALNDLNLNISASNFFGDGNEHRLHNSVFMREQTGANENSNLSTNSSYYHQWTDSLSSQHEMLFSTYGRGNDSTDTLSLSSSVGHKLFSSLNSNAGVRWSTAQYNVGSLDTYGVNGALSYTKNTPIGRLGLSQTLDALVRERGSLLGNATVVGESYLYTPGVPIYLSNIAVDSLSVVVRDSAGLIVYTRNADYFVVQIGSRTRIDVPVTSLISSGDTILVDYDFQPTPEQEIQTMTSTSTMSLSMQDVASFSAGRSTTMQSLNAGFDDGTLEDSTRTYASVNYFPWIVTTLRADFEDYASNISPFRRLSASVEQGLPFSDALEWRAAARTYHVTFADDPRAETGSSASMTMFAFLSPTMNASFNTEFHTAQFRTDQGTGYMAEVQFQKTLGQTTFTLSGRYVDEQFEFADDQSLMFLQILVARNF